VSASRPGRTLPPGKTRYPYYRRLGGPQGRPGQVRKISPLPGFDARTVQPVGRRYADYATRPPKLDRQNIKSGAICSRVLLVNTELCEVSFVPAGNPEWLEY